MATIITNECINCGACEPECPNTAIYAGGVEWELNGVKRPAIATDIFYIVRDKCTECVGFFDHEACAAVCPVDCCIPDPNNPEEEDVLIVRAEQLHPDQTFAGDVPSRFRKTGAAASAPPKEVAKPASAAVGVAPSAVPTPPPAAVLTPAAAPSPAPDAVPEAVPMVKPLATATPAVRPEPASVPAAKLAPPKPGVEPKPAAPQSASELKPPVPKPVAEPKAAAAAAAAPQPAGPPAPSPAVAAVSAETIPSGPDIGEWQIPIECFRCRRASAVPFKHFRTGVVLYCPFCLGSYVVNSSMHNGVNRIVRDFHKRLCEQLARSQAQSKEELEEFAQRQRAQMEAFSESLKEASRQFRPPGAPRRRARMFG